MEDLMNMNRLTKIPNELYTGRTIIHVSQGMPRISRISQMYPEIRLEKATNAIGIVTGRYGIPDGYYDCPFDWIKQAEFTTTFTPRELFLLCAGDWCFRQSRN